jgi:hypothetical protein
MGRIVIGLVGDEVGASLLPTQLAVNTRGGTEILARFSQAFFDAHTSNAIGGLDIRNAFNTLRRGGILEGIREFCPQLCKLFHLCYSGQAELWNSAGDTVGSSETGVRQGDPLAFLFYCCGLQRHLLRLKGVFAEHCGGRECHLLAYADDIHLFGPVEGCVSFMRQDFSYLDRFGITFVPRKFKLIGTTVPDIQDFPSSREGAIILGIPCGTPQYVRSQSRVEIDGYLKNLKSTLLTDAQSAILLVKNCFNKRPVYLSRVIENEFADVALSTFDEAITDVILRISLCNGNDEDVRVADALRALPDRCGGLGILKHCSAVRDHGLAASRTVYSSFVQEHFPALHREDLYPPTPWEIWVREQDVLGVEHRPAYVDLSTPKKALLSWHETQKSKLMELLNIPQRFVVQSSSYPNSARWLKWMGGMRQRFTWQQEPFRNAIRSRLLQLNPPPNCNCQAPAPTVVHGLDCVLNGDLMTTRHNLIRDIVAAFMEGMLGTAAVDREPEVPLTRVDEVKKADVGIRLPGGARVFIDVTVVNIAANSYRRGGAFDIRRKAKLAEYADMVAGAGTIIPMVVSATGMVDGESLRFLDSFLRVDNTTKHYLKSLCLAEINAVTHQYGALMMLSSEAQQVAI